MTKAAVCYDSWHGHTAKIAERIEQQLQQREVDVTVHSLRKGESPPFESLDAVIVVAPIHASRHSKFTREFVQNHGLKLSCIPGMFLSVSLAAAGDARQQDDAIKVMEDFLEETSWRPTFLHTIAGELAYRRYTWLTRWVMRWIAWRSGGATDVGRNHVYTDWSQLEEFVDEFADSLAGSKTRTSATSQKRSLAKVAS